MVKQDEDPNADTHWRQEHRVASPGRENEHGVGWSRDTSKHRRRSKKQKRTGEDRTN